MTDILDSPILSFALGILFFVFSYINYRNRRRSKIIKACFVGFAIIGALIFCNLVYQSV